MLYHRYHNYHAVWYSNITRCGITVVVIIGVVVVYVIVVGGGVNVLNYHSPI